MHEGLRLKINNWLFTWFTAFNFMPCNIPVVEMSNYYYYETLCSYREYFTSTCVINPNETTGWIVPKVYKSCRFDFSHGPQPEYQSSARLI